MTSDSDAIKPGSDENMVTREEDGLDGQLKRLENDFRDLTEKAQNLLTERVYLENEVGQQKKKVNLNIDLSSINVVYAYVLVYHIHKSHLIVPIVIPITYI